MNISAKFNSLSCMPLIPCRLESGLFGLVLYLHCLTGCYGLNWAPPPNLYVKAPIPNVTVFGDGAFREVIKVEVINEVIGWGPGPPGVVSSGEEEETQWRQSSPQRAHAGKAT